MAFIISAGIGAIVGTIVTGITGFSVIGWAAGIVIFLICLPGALIGGFAFDITSYVEDRADDRQVMSEFYEDCRAAEHEDREDERARRKKNIVYDQRSVHFHSDGTTKTIRSKE